jgi:hypothetical protein
MHSGSYGYVCTVHSGETAPARGESGRHPRADLADATHQPSTDAPVAVPSSPAPTNAAEAQPVQAATTTTARPLGPL